VAQSDPVFPPPASGPPEFAARATTTPGGDVWFTIGQAWSFEENGETAYTVRLTMVPTEWDGQLVLMKIRKEA
jgi:hypothetical protein